MLAESADIKTDAFRELYGEFGDEVVQKCVNYHIRHAGISRVRKIEIYHREFLGQPLTPTEVTAWAQRYSDIVERQVVEVGAVPGAVEFLQTAQGQLKLYVISGTPDDELKRIVTKRGWNDYFDEVHGSPRLKPEIIDDIVTRNGLDKDRVLFVGDAMTDYDAAQDRDMAFLGRIAPHHDDLFPPGTETIQDLTGLWARISA